VSLQTADIIWVRKILGGDYSTKRAMLMMRSSYDLMSGAFKFRKTSQINDAKVKRECADVLNHLN